jgi:hypothetical protein
VDEVSGWISMTTTYAMLPTIQGCARWGRDVFADAAAHQSSVAKDSANDAIRI